MDSPLSRWSPWRSTQELLLEVLASMPPPAPDPRQADLFPELLPRCAECGEHWPCSDADSKRLRPALAALHRPRLPLPVYTGRAMRQELTRRWGLPNACPRPGEGLFGVCRLLFLDDEDGGRPVAYWLPD